MVKKDEPLLFGSDRDYPPLSFFPKEGSKETEAAGFDIDLLSEIEAITNLHTQSILGTWSDILESLNNGSLDAVTGIIRTNDRKEIFDFSIPYIFDSYIIFSHKNSEISSVEDLFGKKGAILTSDAVIESFLKPNELTTQITYTSSFTSALQLVVDKRADYTIAPFSLGKSIIAKEGLNQITNVGRPLIPIKYRIAVQKGDTELLFALNEAIFELRKNNTIHNLYQKWKVEHPFDRTEVAPPSSFYLLAGGGVLLIILLFTTWIVLFRTSMKRQTARVISEKNFLLYILKALPFRLSWKDLSQRFAGTNISEAGGDEDAQEERADISEEVEKAVLRTGKSYVAREKEGYLKTSVLPVFNRDGEITGTLTCRESLSDEFMMRESFKKIAEELSRTKQRLEELEVSDPLTGLYNQDYIKKCIREEIALYHRYGKPFSLLFIEYTPRDEETIESDNILEENSIIETGKLIKSQIRNVDIAARLDGGAFLIMLTHTTLSDAQKAAKKIVNAFRDPKIRYSTIMYQGENREHFIAQIRSFVRGRDISEFA